MSVVELWEKAIESITEGYTKIGISFTLKEENKPSSPLSPPSQPYLSSTLISPPNLQTPATSHDPPTPIPTFPIFHPVHLPRHGK